MSPCLRRQLPQYAVLGFGEILTSTTGLEFAYSQAPSSMKSVVTALFLLTSAVGNVLTGASTLGSCAEVSVWR